MNVERIDIEKELTAALGRTSPPAGFRDRVLARIHEETSSRSRVRSAYAGRWTRFAAAALLVLSTGLLSSHYVMETRREAAGERAKHELVLAMKIASEKTNLARQEVLEMRSGSVNGKGDQR